MENQNHFVACWSKDEPLSLPSGHGTHR
jgi:hypothetical protein